MPSYVTHVVDYAIFIGYSLLMWETISAWWWLRKVTDKRKEAILTALLIAIMISILTFIGANAYMLQYRGETLLSMRIFQIFVMANFFVYWLILTLLKKEVVDGDST